MGDSDLHTRIAVLESKMIEFDRRSVSHEKDLRTIRTNLTELVSGAKVLKWVLGVSLTAGPALGVALAKLFGS